MTLGIEPATFGFVASCLAQLRTAVEHGLLRRHHKSLRKINDLKIIKIMGHTKASFISIVNYYEIFFLEEITSTCALSVENPRGYQLLYHYKESRALKIFRGKSTLTSALRKENAIRERHGNLDLSDC
jgi:hypothetical protein